MKKLKNLFLICLFIFVNHTFGQSYNYIIEYDYVYQSDSTDLSSLNGENMLLLYDKDKSLFISKPKFQLDSLRQKVGNDIQMFFSLKKNLPKNRVKFEIEKDFNHSSPTYYEHVFTTTYRNKFKNDLNYKLINKDSIIAGYNCKKAEVNLSGRNYTIWYTNEIAIPDGPYKFSGLPGLVIELYDDKDQHHFKLMSIKKKEVTYNPIRTNVVDASMREIQKARKNKLQVIKNSGFSISPELVKKAKKNLKSQNNPIELIVQ